MNPSVHLNKIKNLKLAYSTAQNAATNASSALRQALKDAVRDRLGDKTPPRMLFGKWDCQHSPTGECVYTPPRRFDFYSNNDNNCIFCDISEERT